MTPRLPAPVTGLCCLLCGTVHPPGDHQTCPACGPEGILDVQYDLDTVREAWARSPLVGRPANQWRYRELLPLAEGAARPALQVGWTPLHEAPRLAQAFGVARAWIKDDGRNPTSSLKDRASAVAVAKALEFGYDTIACASTGNAASSLAGMAAAVGMSAVIFVPERAPEPKITQLLIFGARVFRVRGSYEQAFDLCRAASSRFGWYNRNSGTNPYPVEGKKTAGLEIAEQMREFPPDWVAVSVGDGCTIGGVGKGLAEMLALGQIDRMPRLLGVQAAGARPIVDAFRTGGDLAPAVPDTLADSIAVGTPRNWRRALAQVRASHGAFAAVSDPDILEAMRLTARLGGVFGEPAGVAGAAGVRQAVVDGIIRPDETVLVLVTGNGLKDIQSARAAAGAETLIEPDLEALTRIVGDGAAPAPTTVDGAAPRRIVTAPATTGRP